MQKNRPRKNCPESDICMLVSHGKGRQKCNTCGYRPVIKQAKGYTIRADALVMFLKRLGLQQRDVVKVLGESRSNVSRWFQTGSPDRSLAPINVDWLANTLHVRYGVPAHLVPGLLSDSRTPKAWGIANFRKDKKPPKTTHQKKVWRITHCRKSENQLEEHLHDFLKRHKETTNRSTPRRSYVCEIDNPNTGESILIVAPSE